MPQALCRACTCRCKDEWAGLVSNSIWGLLATVELVDSYKPRWLRANSQPASGGSGGVRRLAHDTLECLGAAAGPFSTSTVCSPGHVGEALEGYCPATCLQNFSVF